MKKLLLTLAFCFTCLFAYADTVTYYFNAYDEGEAWNSYPASMVDGSTSGGSNGYDEEIELLTGNTCDGTDLGTISKVEIRAYGNYKSNDATVILRPVFSGISDGNNHSWIMPSSSAWSDYYDITSDTNHPETWSWSDVQNLDCDVEADVSTDGRCWVAKVEIRVTYSGEAPADVGQVIMIQ